MDTSVNDETIVVLRSYNKQKLAVYLILASILFQNTAYLILDSALDEILHDNRTLNWTDHNSFIVLYVFKGKLNHHYFLQSITRLFIRH